MAPPSDALSKVVPEREAWRLRVRILRLWKVPSFNNSKLPSSFWAPDCKTFMTTMQEVAESQGKGEENKDASNTAGLLDKLTVGDNKSEEKDVTIIDKKNKQAVDENEKPEVDKKDEPAPPAEFNGVMAIMHQNFHDMQESLLWLVNDFPPHRLLQIYTNW